MRGGARPERTDITKERVERLRRSGMVVSEIAEILCCSCTLIYKVMCDDKVPKKEEVKKCTRCKKRPVASGNHFLCNKCFLFAGKYELQEHAILVKEGIKKR